MAAGFSKIYPICDPAVGICLAREETPLTATCKVSIDPIFLFFCFPFIISVLEKDHPTGSKLCCCIPRFRTPVCVLSVLVKSAVELEQKSALLGKYFVLSFTY